MNHLSGVDRLANRFSIMRHGQSKANARGIIVSRIENDQRGDYGLSELGRQQALAAARGCGLPGNTVICSSDFSRARQTAEIVRAHLGAPEVVIAEALRERCFGDWEGSATGNYARVWAADETNPGYAGGNVEPALAVLDRSTAFIVDLERRYSGHDIFWSPRGHAADPAGGLPADEPVPAPEPAGAEDRGDPPVAPGCPPTSPGSSSGVKRTTTCVVIRSEEKILSND